MFCLSTSLKFMLMFMLWRMHLYSNTGAHLLVGICVQKYVYMVGFPGASNQLNFQVTLLGKTSFVNIHQIEANCL